MNAQSKLAVMRNVATMVNSIPVAPSNTPSAFIELASSWLGGWWRLRSGWQNVTPGYCALVLEPEFKAKAAANQFEELNGFRDGPTAALGGAIYVSDGALAKVHRQRGAFPDINALTVSLRAAGLSSYPAVLFEPEVGAMLLADRGVEHPLTRLQLGHFDKELTVDNVDKLLSSLYFTTLKYPETFPHVWSHADKFIPMAYAEKFFQGVALIHLRAMAQDAWMVRPEDHTNAGRADLAILSLASTCTFVLEIKVLKAFQYNRTGVCRACKPDYNEKWAKEGIQQVIDYRSAKEASEAFLLLYDMRQKDKDLLRVKAQCASERVHHRRYFVHNQSASKIRRAAKPGP